ncbi:MAG: DUF1311 domain-containing protein [Shewanella sp.]|nr:DUF1311 domain-containing protein [Shewanella sp.]
MFNLKKLVCVLIVIPFICSAKDLIKDAIEHDKRLNVTYESTMKLLDKSHKLKLKKAQLLWTKYRNTMCEFENDLPNHRHWIENEISNSQQLECISRLSITRKKELNEYAKSAIQQQKNNNKNQVNLELDARTLKLNVKGESFYSEKNYDAAYEVFDKIIQLDYSNVRALNNLAIVSLKLGHKNKALTSSHRVIFSLPASSKEKSAALFNMGLACEGTERRWISAERKWFCSQSPLELYTQSFISFPTESRSDLILEKFSNAKASENKCQLNEGQYKSYFKRSNKFVFLHEIKESDFLNGLTKDTRGNKVSFNRTATGKLSNGLYISTFWASSSKTITLDNESCEFINRLQSSDSHNKVAIKQITIKPKEKGASQYLDKLSNKLIKYGYKECDNIDYCFNGEWLNQMTFNATPNGVIVTIPLSHIPKRQDVIKELSKIESVLEDGSYIRRLCKKSINTWVYGLVAEKCLII